MWWRRAAAVGLTVIASLALIYLPFAWNVVVGGLGIVLALAAAATAQPTGFVGAVFVAIPLVGAVGTFMGNFTQFARQIGWITPTYGIAVDHPVIVLGQNAHAKLIGSIFEWRQGQPGRISV